MLSRDIQIGTGTAYAKELTKWEAQHTQYGPPGRPYEYREYPAMMYKPTRARDSGTVTYEHQVVETEHERSVLEALGFVAGGKGKALEALERREFEIAELAAARAAEDRLMGARALSEADAKDSATIQHLAEIPAEPIRRGPGRPRKDETNGG